jgi:uncharacterized protein (TIGR00369 family)
MHPYRRMGAVVNSKVGATACGSAEAPVKAADPFPRVGLVRPDVVAHMSGIDLLRGLLDATLPAPPFSEAAGVWPVSFEAGQVVFEAMPSARFYNPMGVVHGGWLALLLDTAMGCAVHSTLEPGLTFTTVEMKTGFVRPVRESSGKLRCQAAIVHAGSRIASAEGRILDAAGRLVAHGSETCLISALAATASAPA